jgi:NADH-quinone oxidoreductase subunit J
MTLGTIAIEFLMAFGGASALMVLFAPKTSASTCFLLFTFSASAVLILCFDFEFLAYALITIYVGALAVVLLFLIKVLYPADSVLGLSLANGFGLIITKFLLFFLCFLAFYARYLSIAEGFFLFNLSFNQNGSQFFASFKSSAAALLGTTLYNHSSILLLIASYVLLLGMVGAISVVFNSTQYETARRLRKTRSKAYRFFSPKPLRGLYRSSLARCPRNRVFHCKALLAHGRDKNAESVPESCG